MRDSRATATATPPAPRARRSSTPDPLSLLNRLTDRDHTLLALLGEHDVLTTDQIARLLFPNLDRAQRRLLTLHRWQVLDRFRRPGLDGHMTSWRYTLGPAGATVLAALRGTTPTKPRDLRDRTLRLAANPRLDHLLGVNDFFATLTHHARTSEGELVGWLGERSATHACGRLARPDSIGIWRQHNVTALFCLEFDTGREPLTTVTAKLDGYTDLAHAGGPQLPERSTLDGSLADTGFVVLFHLHSLAREAHLRERLARAGGAETTSGDRAPWSIATTTAELMGQHSPADAVWLPATSNRRCSLADLTRH